MTRVSKILRSTLPRESNRFDLGLIRGLFLLSAFLVLLGTLFVIPISSTMGRQLLTAFLPLSAMLLAYLAGRLNRDSVGDASTGFLSLLSLTGTTRWEWMVVRLTQIWCGFLSVWIIRLPILLFLVTLGGASWSDLVTMEIMLLLLFGAASSAAMVKAHQSDDRKSADWAGLTQILRIEFCLLLGQIIIGLLALMGISSPPAVDAIAQWLAECSLYQRWLHFFGGFGLASPLLSWEVATYAFLCVALTGASLLKYYRLLYAGIGDSPHGQLASKKEKKQERKLNRDRLPRCWDDAIAWQSYVYYCGGADNTVGRVILYCVAFLLIVASFYSPILKRAGTLTLVLSSIAIIHAMNTPAHCLQKETKANTLPNLILTPHDGIDLYRGWYRGALWLAIPDFIYAALVALVMYFIEPLVSLAIVGVVLTAVLSGPFFLLTHLVPVSLRGLATNLFVVFGLFGVVAIGIFAAHSLHPVAFPFAAIPAFWIYNCVLLHFFVDPWLSRRIDSMN